MLYCPKCQATYQEGTQRFCTNEGVRLLPVSTSPKSSERPIGVFSSILGKSLGGSAREKFDSTESEVRGEKADQSKNQSFQPPGESKFFKGEKNTVTQELELKPEPTSQPADSEKKSQRFEPLPLAHIIDPGKIPEKQSKFDELFEEESPKTVVESETSTEVEPIEIAESIEAESDELSVETEPPASPEPIEYKTEPETSNEPPFEDPPSESEELELNLDEFDLLGEDHFDEEQQPYETEELPDFSALELEIEGVEPEESPFEDEINQGTEVENSFEDEINAESDDEFQLNLTEPAEVSPAVELKPDFELEINEIDETPVSDEPPPGIEWDLDDSSEAFVQDEALPQIELELDGIETSDDIFTETNQIKQEPIDLEPTHQADPVEAVEQEPEITDFLELTDQAEVIEESKKRRQW